MAKGARAWLGHHIGDLRHPETLRAFRDGVEHFERVFAVAPEVVAHDLHPDYLSTVYALEREGVEHVAVQHHHAHLAACLAEHGETGPAVGAIYDGSGLGAGRHGVGRRAAGRRPRRLRARRPPARRCGCPAATRRCASRGGWPARGSSRRSTPTSRRCPPRSPEPVDEARWRAVAGAGAPRRAMAPVTTSAGRLFDAVAALCGLRATVTYEGQAAAELEACRDPHERGAYPLADRAPTACSTRARRSSRSPPTSPAGVPAGVVSARFHRALADATARRLRARRRAPRHSGSPSSRAACSRTARCSTRPPRRPSGAGLRVLVPERVPPNDGGIAFGQAAVAAR